MQSDHKFFVTINALFFTLALLSMKYDIDPITRNTIVNNSKRKSSWLELSTQKKIKSSAYCPKTEKIIVAYSTHSFEPYDPITISSFDLARKKENQRFFWNWGGRVQFVDKGHFGVSTPIHDSQFFYIHNNIGEIVTTLLSDQQPPIFNKIHNGIIYCSKNRLNFYDLDKKKNTVLSFSTTKNIVYQTYHQATNKIALILGAPDTRFESSSLLLTQVVT